LVNFVHDELALEARKDLTAEVSPLIVDEMTEALLALFRPYNPKLVARELVEVGAGNSYAEVKQ
jgi:DNA polymerase I-like protein with 3'-5' exonuclease and polymerase domains